MPSRLSTSYRMNRIFRDDRAALIVPIDHGLVWGRVPSLEALGCGVRGGGMTA